jgi:hypothetical protein
MNVFSTEKKSPHPQFQKLCEAIRSNDPKVTRICTDRVDLPYAYGRRLCAAFCNSNSVVTELNLNLAHFLSKTEEKALTTKAATPLLDWIKSTSSLRTVRLSCSSGHNASFHHLDAAESLLAHRLLQAMAQNSGIQTVDSELKLRSHVWTEYLSSHNAASHLQSLKLTVWTYQGHEDSESLARAIGALSALRVLTHFGKHVEPILHHLHSSLSKLKELSIDFSSSYSRSNESTVDHLCTVLCAANELTTVTLQNLQLSREYWKKISAALSSNPSIATLKLVRCAFSDEAATKMFLKHMKSPLGSQTSAPPPVGKLHLVGCQFKFPPLPPSAQPQLDDSVRNIIPVPRSSHVALARMLRGSGLEHLTVDKETMDQYMSPGAYYREKPCELRTFGNALTQKGQEVDSPSAVRLRSLDLPKFDGNHLHQLSRYLMNTVHLEHLTVDAHRLQQGRFLRDSNRFVIPDRFLSILRANGSLHQVDFKDSCRQENRPFECFERIIEAIATRNRLLPQLLPASFLEKDIDDDNDSNGAPVASAKKRLSVTLCQAAQQAPRLAPNNVLKGLLAASDNGIGSTTSICGSKRVAGG